MIDIAEFKRRKAECDSMFDAAHQADLRLEQDVFWNEVFDEWNKLGAKKETVEKTRAAISAGIEAGIDSEWIAASNVARYLRQHERYEKIEGWQ